MSEAAEQNPKRNARDHVYLVDGSAYIFRAFHGLPPMTRPDGTPVNAVFGFSNMLTKLVQDTEAQYMAVVFDTARKTFRSEIYPEYKAQRPPPPDDLIPQFALIREATDAFNLPRIEMDGFEADDIIATYAKQAVESGHEVTIVSSDKDLMQLVGDNVRMMDPMKNRIVGADEVRERFGVGPDKVIDVQALAGDSSDNVPGVPGIGVKTAAELINVYGDLDNLLDHAEEIKQPKRRENLVNFADQARVSRELVTLRLDVPLEMKLDELALHEPDPEPLLAFLREQGFKSTIAKLQLGGGASETDIVPDASARPDPASAVSDYELVQTIDRLQAWVDDARIAGVVAVDTETTSLDSMRAELVGVSLSIRGGKACYIPLAHVGARPQGTLDLDLNLQGDAGADETPEQIPMDQALGLLRPLLADRGVLKIGHNIKYDMEVLARYDVTVTPIDDTMILSYVLEGGSHGHGLDELSLLHFEHANIKFSEVAGAGKKQIGFAEVPLDKALDYAAEDADMTARLHLALKPRLATEHMTVVYENIERALIPVLAEVEKAGIKVDAAELKALSDDFEKRGAILGEEIHKLAGHEFNIASPKQLGEVLFDEMGLSGGKKGKTGAYSTDASVLEGLAAQGHDLPARVLDWRQLAKLRSTYTEALIGQINPDTGRVHTSFGQAIASTGRLSSTDPNLQNIPVRTEDGRKIRRAFVADKGNILLSADYSQIELRLLAHVADIASLKEAFMGGADIHARTASEVFGIPMEGMDGAVRNRAKAINFGIIYGISPFGLARQLKIPQGEAKQYIESYFEHYPGIRDYMEKTKEFARTNGYVTTILGRKCHVPGIQDKNPARRNFSERAAVNAPLQGAAADIIKLAMIRVPKALKDTGLAARMLLQVHDELVFEVPEAELDRTIDVVSKVMSGAAHLSIPLVVDTGTGTNWADAH
ncbi:MAG: DNA polymerase I [Pseudomonadota bacterium]|nr:DNA polymerase I [Pseudomonadota bacterium]